MTVAALFSFSWLGVLLCWGHGWGNGGKGEWGVELLGRRVGKWMGMGMKTKDQIRELHLFD